MKKSASLFVLLLTLFVSISYPSVVASSGMWSQIYESARHGCAYSVVETSDGGYAIAGESGVGSDFCLLKTDKGGNMLWNKTYGGSNTERAISLVETSDGGYALAGYTGSFGQGEEVWLVKTDVNGNMQWNRTYGGPDSENAHSMIKTSDGGYVIAGYVQYSDVEISGSLVVHRGSDFWLVKTDSNGNMVWNQTYGGKEDEYAFSVVETSDGGYALAGYTESFGQGEEDCWLVKTDADGNMLWNRAYGGPDSERAYSVVQLSDGSYAMFGDGLLIKTDEHGYMVWNQTYGGGVGYGCSGSLAATSDGGYAFVLGSRLIKTDSQGNMEWSQTYDGEGATDRGLVSLVETSDGGYTVVGHVWFFLRSGSPFIWAVKTDEYGVVPEFPSWTPVLVMVASLAAVIAVYRYNLKKGIEN